MKCPFDECYQSGKVMLTFQKNKCTNFDLFWKKLTFKFNICIFVLLLSKGFQIRLSFIKKKKKKWNCWCARQSEVLWLTFRFLFPVCRPSWATPSRQTECQNWVGFLFIHKTQIGYGDFRRLEFSALQYRTLWKVQRHLSKTKK